MADHLQDGDAAVAVETDYTTLLDKSPPNATTTEEVKPSPTFRERMVSYSTGSHMMAHGATALHEDIAAKVEAALGKAFPQMEIRFKDLSLTANMVMAHDLHKAVATNEELPTLPNHVLQTIAQVSSKKHTVQKHILKNLSGVFKPGTVTLLLGQSGSGKSAFMKLLSGRFPIDRKRIDMTGSVLFNGTSREEILSRLPQFVAYVTQYDVHFPTLTVQETLEFAHECCGAELSQRAEQFLTQGTPEENEAAIQAARSIVKHYPAIVTEELGLSICEKTLVGDAQLRGVSGGERKRVTTGEMEFGMKYVTLMDEITTGLDSAAAFDIINTQRSIAKRLHKTVIISLLQPSPEVFALFDNVLLLNEGEVLYHGPREDAQAYFASLGFVCPPRRDVADFLCDLGTHQQLQYENTSQLPTELAQFPRHASEFAQLFRKSAIFQAMEQELDAPIDPALLMDVKNHIDPIPEFHENFWKSTHTLVKRQTLLLSRNTAFLKGRALLVAIMGLLFSSVFYQIDFADIQVVMGVLFASILFLGLGQSSMLTTFFRARAVFYKQRSANFYRTSSYVLASSLSQFPLAIAESVIFGSLVYWFGGFVPRVGEFLIFELFLLLSILVFLAWFFFLSAVAPDLHIAKPLGMVSLVIFILFAGFVVTKDQIPDYLIWVYWIDPVAWTLRGLAVSQMRSETYDVCEKDGIVYCTERFKGMTMGEYYLSLFDVPSEKSWVYTGIAFMCGAYLLFMVMSWLVLEYKRYEQPEHITLPKELLESLEAGTAAGSEPDSDSTEPYQALASPKAQEEDQIAVDVEPVKLFDPVTIAFQDLWYSVTVPGETKGLTVSLDLLKGITGYALPGTITALMGSSGAGKTTLMDVIAGRKTGTGGVIKGKILLNGFAASDLAIRRCTGYCEQMDIHSEASTFREALTFSAFLRQSASVSNEAKLASVSECLELLDMHDIADHIIRGSSMEQHKRLTIGVELAAQPSVLFLDEPTSGLDARSAKVIMDGVRKVADSGRTILCTIHQPSSEVFHLFDRLLLLKRGGETVYFGPLGFEGQDLISYFQGLPNVPQIADGYNPATWMLEVIGAGVGGGDSNSSPTEEAVDFVTAYQQSVTKQELLDAKMTEVGLFTPSLTAQQVAFTSKRAATNAVQMRMLMQRFWTLYWRTPSYNWTRLVISLLLGVLFGLVYLDSEYTTYQGINGGLGMIFLSTAFIGVVSFISILPLAFEERAAFYRERASQTYNSLWFFVCFTLVEIPYVCVGAMLFTAVFYPMVGFTGFGDAVFYWLNVMLHVLFQAYMGQFLIFALPSIEVAAVIGVLFNAVFFMFMGFNPPAKSIPSAYEWLHVIAPHRYTFAILSASMFGDCSDDHLQQMGIALKTNTTVDMSSWELGCQFIENAPPSVGNNVPIKMYIDKVFDIKHDDITQYFFIFLAMIVIFRVLAAFAMRYINHQKR